MYLYRWKNNHSIWHSDYFCKLKHLVQLPMEQEDRKSTRLKLQSRRDLVCRLLLEKKKYFIPQQNRTIPLRRLRLVSCLVFRRSNRPPATELYHRRDTPLMSNLHRCMSEVVACTP